MLNDWTSSNDEICADSCNYFRFQVEGKGRSEQWDVNLCGDKTIKVDRDSAEVLPRKVPPLGIGGVDFGSSPSETRILRLEKVHSCGTGFELSAARALCSALSIGVSMIGSQSAVG